MYYTDYYSNTELLEYDVNRSYTNIALRPANIKCVEYNIKQQKM